MSSSSTIHFYLAAATLFFAALFHGPSPSHAQLSPTFYDRTCPQVTKIIRDVIYKELRTDIRIAASLNRLHFHDCFVNGCDGSLLLDNSPTIDSEKQSLGNNNSVRGFDVVDRMKSQLEKVCPGVVSCADILTIASQISVTLSGGPSWTNLLGRRDGLTASRALADENLPSPFDSLELLKQRFTKVGLNGDVDLVALSGAHTFGKARCLGFAHRLFNFSGQGAPDPTLNKSFLKKLQKICPQGGNGSVITDLDVTTPNAFDNAYFTNLKIGKGLLETDQILLSAPGADTADIVKKFSKNTFAFFEAFVLSMIRMGNLSVLTGNQGEIRLNCRVVNGPSTLSDDNLVSSI
ncbi:peroxidase E5-like [Carica papaya]|uniref:peroxidase E5-like n=1 Tax=Carica papaya TaxID=3649 RepID=UPI000B8CC011|nr:peroxidase E5-like [Carica papaya]